MKKRSEPFLFLCKVTTGSIIGSGFPRFENPPCFKKPTTFESAGVAVFQNAKLEATSQGVDACPTVPALETIKRIPHPPKGQKGQK